MILLQFSDDLWINMDRIIYALPTSDEHLNPTDIDLVFGPGQYLTVSGAEWNYAVSQMASLSRQVVIDCRVEEE